jgi:hypothetical protein
LPLQLHQVYCQSQHYGGAYLPCWMMIAATPFLGRPMCPPRGHALLPFQQPSGGQRSSSLLLPPAVVAWNLSIRASACWSSTFSPVRLSGFACVSSARETPQSIFTGPVEGSTVVPCEGLHRAATWR